MEGRKLGSGLLYLYHFFPFTYDLSRVSYPPSNSFRYFSTSSNSIKQGPVVLFVSFWCTLKTWWEKHLALFVGFECIFRIAFLELETFVLELYNFYTLFYLLVFSYNLQLETWKTLNIDIEVLCVSFSTFLTMENGTYWIVT